MLFENKKKKKTRFGRQQQYNAARMDASPAWKSSLTFSDRVASILRTQGFLACIQTFCWLISCSTESYRSAFPEISLAEAQAEGRSAEKEIYRKASSKVSIILSFWTAAEKTR